MGVTTPDKSVLANQMCDFLEGHWIGESTFHVPNNYGSETAIPKKYSKIGYIELATMVHCEYGMMISYL